MLAGIGPQRALKHLREAAESEGRAPATRIDVVFVEPLDSRRAETQFIARVQDAGDGAEVSARLLLHPQGRWVDQALGPLAAPLRSVCRLWTSRAPALLHVTLALLRWQMVRQQARALQSQVQREHQLKLQLSFAGGASAPPQPPTETPRRTP